MTVYEGRREFKRLEAAARRAGLSKTRLREYLPYRMLEVEVAANAVYTWAAEQIVERRLVEETIGVQEYAKEIRLQMQDLRYRFHDRLMQAFLDPRVFEGGVRVERVRRSAEEQLPLVEA